MQDILRVSMVLGDEAGALVVAPTWFWSPVLCFRAQSRTDKPGNVPLSDGFTPPRWAQALQSAFYLCPLHLWRVPTAARSAKCCALVLGMSPGPGHHPHCQGCPCPEVPGWAREGDRKRQSCSALAHPTEHLTSSCLALEGLQSLHRVCI